MKVNIPRGHERWRLCQSALEIAPQGLVVSDTDHVKVLEFNNPAQ